jgi:hypothetical protein
MFVSLRWAQRNFWHHSETLIGEVGGKIAHECGTSLYFEPPVSAFSIGGILPS